MIKKAAIKKLENRVDVIMYGVYRYPSLLIISREMGYVNNDNWLYANTLEEAYHIECKWCDEYHAVGTASY